MRCHSASALAVWPSTTASHQAPVWISITGARSLAAISIWRGSAAMNSDTRMPASLSLAMNGCRRVVLAGDVEPAFGGQLLAPLRHQAHRMRFGRERNPQHVVGRRHLEIQRLGDFGLQPRHVLVADVAAVFAQMRGDAVGAGLDRGKCGAHGIGTRAGPRIAQGGDVIDIDAKAQRRRLWAWANSQTQFVCAGDSRPEEPPTRPRSAA